MTKWMILTAMLFIAVPAVAQESSSGDDPGSSEQAAAPPSEAALLQKQVDELKAENASLRQDVDDLTQVAAKLVELEKQRKAKSKRSRFDDPPEVERIKMPSAVFIAIPVVASGIAWAATSGDRPIGARIATGAGAGLVSGSILGAGYALEDIGLMVSGSILGVAAIASGILL